MSSPSAQYTVRHVGIPNTLDYRAFIEKNGEVVSPFHDIPLYANAEKTVLNMIVEVPRWTNAKMEISKEELMNPIKQDSKKDRLRYVRNCFPHHGYIWNYGAFPQTWEDPSVINSETKAKGDNDPLDVCEIGETVGYIGQVKQVKVLGAMALIDEGETDWKIIVIDVNDPLAPRLNDVEDIERHLPGLIRATNEWFRIYKIPDGKPENNFAFSGECKNKKYASEIIRECLESWDRLISGKSDSGSINCTNTTISYSPFYSNELINIPFGENHQPAPRDPSIDKNN
ncbi:unnamed protein product [Pneumocystis jirovecii]|uniref:Inorganic pyrophosphatase n=1 Tax=Pneumocystis jirovecii TaxID=42068 RepID=L0PDC7_PNEJI|nr:unnamed protein product [Pneumocystis jirovecii]